MADEEARPRAVASAPTASCRASASWTPPPRSPRARLRGHQHRAGEREVRPAGELHLLALQGQGRPDRRRHRTQLRQWLVAWQMPDEGDPRERSSALAMQIAKALLDSPDFIRLGLMLALERRPVEPRARAMFLEARAQAFDMLSAQPSASSRPG